MSYLGSHAVQMPPPRQESSQEKLIIWAAFCDEFILTKDKGIAIFPQIQGGVLQDHHPFCFFHRSNIQGALLSEW